MTASTKAPRKLPQPHIYEALSFEPATSDGTRSYTQHLIAAFDHADAVARFRAEGLIGAETYVQTDVERSTTPNFVVRDAESSRIEPITTEQYAGWVSVMLYEIRDGDKLVRGPNWVRVAP